MASILSAWLGLAQHRQEQPSTAQPTVVHPSRLEPSTAQREATYHDIVPLHLRLLLRQLLTLQFEPEIEGN